jgi:diguanylate cyclase (GGDEF)-like protein
MKNFLDPSVCSVVLNNLDMPVYVTEQEDGIIIMANQAFEAVFGADWAGRTTGDLLPSSSEEREEEAEEWRLEKDGSYFFVRRRAIPWTDGHTRTLCQAQDITHWKKQEDGHQELAYTDYLTGLPNRRACDNELLLMLERLCGAKTPGFIFFIDLDDFKVVNDSFGHDYGDGVLVAFADFLRQRFQGMDKVFRLGGDEFVVVVDPVNGLMVPEYLEDMLVRARQPWVSRDREFYCSLSIGVVEFIARLENAGSILKKADIAMYHAKKTGKNNYAYFTEGLDSETVDRSETEELLRKAILNDFSGFEILYQPYYALNQPAAGSAKKSRGRAGARPAGAEALLRLRGQAGELIAARDFIGLSEYLGLIVPMGEYVLRRAASLCKQVNDKWRADFSVSVNLSVVQFKRKNLALNIEKILHDTKVKPENMIIGINEGVAMSEKKNALNYCAQFRRSGFRVSMDDFGSDNASFINMRDLPVDVIKISPMYLHAHTDEFAKNFIKLACKLGHFSGKTVCLTGVETKAQLDFCRRVGADMVQGYWFSMPESEDKLLELVGSGTA